MNNIREKEIFFVLPQFLNYPIGGYKIVFEYANKLCQDNFKVKILFLNSNALKKYKIPQWSKKLIMQYRTKKGPKWFNLNEKIQCISVFNDKANMNKENPNIVIATDSTTTTFVNKFFNSSKKFYFIQGYETWNMSKNELYETYNLGFTNITVSNWLKKIVDSHSKTPSKCVNNPIDLNVYREIIPVNGRKGIKIGMLYSDSPNKGSKYVIKALLQVKKYVPNLKVVMFGTSDIPKNLPDWFSYYKDATQEQTVNIYNNIKIFVSGSINEGFGLTGLEAMACGATLISNDYAAVHEYAVNNSNSILVKIKDTNKLADTIIQLLDNDKYRIKLAKAGLKSVKKFSWSKSYTKFKNILLEACDGK